jgi:hypothetical protein
MKVNKPPEINAQQAPQSLNVESMVDALLIEEGVTARANRLQEPENRIGVWNATLQRVLSKLLSGEVGKHWIAAYALLVEFHNGRLGCVQIRAVFEDQFRSKRSNAEPPIPIAYNDYYLSVLREYKWAGKWREAAWRSAVLNVAVRSNGSIFAFASPRIALGVASPSAAMFPIAPWRPDPKVTRDWTKKLAGQ